MVYRVADDNNTVRICQFSLSGLDWRNSCVDHIERPEQYREVTAEEVYSVHPRLISINDTDDEVVPIQTHINGVHIESFKETESTVDTIIQCYWFQKINEVNQPNLTDKFNKFTEAFKELQAALTVAGFKGRWNND